MSATTVEPPGEQWEEQERPRKEENHKVGAQGTQAVKVVRKLIPLGGGPLRAVPLLHQQGHQALDFKQRRPNSIPLAADWALKKLEQLCESVTHVTSHGDSMPPIASA
ncbi:hypothetical protein YTPLAS18_39350 [Nitrospira sp.]|nr:hypothetical protein YTPLAS18_39350 [Nitrospira sp.]